MNNQTSLKKRKYRPSVYALLTILVIGIAGVIFYLLTGGPYSVYVNGKSIVTVESRSVAKHILSAVKTDDAGSIRFAQKVSIKRSPSASVITDYHEAVELLKNATSFEIERFAVLAEDKPVVALPDRKKADETLKLVKVFYEKSLDNINGDSIFKENVSVSKLFVPLDMVCSTPEEAVNKLTAVTVPPTVHIIKRGDRAIHIARDYGISISTLKNLNPDINMEQLTEGKELMISPGKKPLTVITKAFVTKTTNLDSPSDAHRRRSSMGKRISKVMATYENGIPVDEEILSQVTTWDRPKVSESYDDNYHRSRHRSRRSRTPRHLNDSRQETVAVSTESKSTASDE